MLQVRDGLLSHLDRNNTSLNPNLKVRAVQVMEEEGRPGRGCHPSDRRHLIYSHLARSLIQFARMRHGVAHEINLREVGGELPLRISNRLSIYVRVRGA